MEEAIKIDHVYVLCQMVAVELIPRHKLAILKLVQLLLHQDGDLGQVGQVALSLAAEVHANELAHVETMQCKDHVPDLDKKPKSVMHKHVHHQLELGDNGALGQVVLSRVTMD